jgi:hypothetical protein
MTMTRIYLSVLLALTALVVTNPANAQLTLSYPTVTHTIPAAVGSTPGTDWLEINCPSGTKVVSGGWTTSSTAAPHIMVWVNRQVGNSWRIMTLNQSSSTFTITGTAVCAAGVGLTTYFTSVGVNVPSFSGAGGNVPCSSGGIPTGGGFDSNFPNPGILIPVMTYPTFQNQWNSTEYNSTNTTRAFTAFVTCMKNVSATVTPVFGNWVTWQNGLSPEAFVECNPGDVAIGGGYVSSVTSSNLPFAYQRVRTMRNGPTATNSRRWTVRANNANQFDWASIRPVAQCLHLN